ncbi:MAG TPA: protein kinase [Candidatus Polarisedimenticolaceae bacterium]
MRTALDASAPFRALPPALLDLVVAKATLRDFAAGETIIAQGAAAGALYVLSAGEARVVLHDHGVARSLATVGRGAVLGEMALLTAGPSTAEVVAATDVRALELLPADFFALVADHPDLAVVLTHLVAERLGSARGDGLGGKVLEGYRIGRPVGRGAMSVVYEAEEVASGRRVALKMMSHRLVHRADAIARFEREARVLRSLDHPGIARLIGDFPAFGTRFLVLEFVEGESLDRRLERDGALRTADALKLLARIADALAHVHARGVVHRDLKPGNVMLPNAGGVKLLDFGLADTGVEHVIAGSVLYMPPEQMEGKDSGPAADVYAFACMAIEMLSGRLPFEGRTPERLHEEKLRYVVPQAEQIAPRLPAKVHAFLAAAMLPEAERRPAMKATVFVRSPLRFFGRWNRATH